MAKQPADRYPTAQAMADALRDALRGDTAATLVTSDRTVVAAPSGVAGDEAGDVRFDPTVLDSIERKLARHVGPIAKRLVDSASRKADSIETLCETLARSIQGSAERTAFLGEALGAVRTQFGAGGTQIGSAPRSPIPAAEIERVQRDLAKIMGPIARVLVKRALGSAGSAQALRESLAVHVEKPADRAAFLKGS